jgi:hypothetical protein
MVNGRKSLAMLEKNNFYVVSSISFGHVTNMFFVGYINLIYVILYIQHLF